jgi:hypothetical protein
MAEKGRTLYKKADAVGLATLIFEAMLVGPTTSAAVNKDGDPKIPHWNRGLST